MRILLVDDEEAIIHCLETILVSEGHKVWACLLDNQQSAERVVSLARFMHFHIALIDLIMPAVTGDILAARLRQVAPSMRLVMLVRRNAMGCLFYDREVVDDFVLEPFERAELIRALYRA